MREYHLPSRRAKCCLDMLQMACHPDEFFHHPGGLIENLDMDVDQKIGIPLDLPPTQ